MDEKVRKTARMVEDRCKVCRKNKRSFSRPSVALPKVVDFNQIVTFDLKKWGSKQILWMVCSFTRFLKGVVLNNKEGPTVRCFKKSLFLILMKQITFSHNTIQYKIGTKKIFEKK